MATISPAEPAARGGETVHVRFIDAVRGYAVSLVILCHTVYLFPGLPYPVHRVAVLGWHGVQLFFLASAVTLLMSWHREIHRHGAAHAGAFFLRRFFRIAPAYYVAAAFYFWLTPPMSGFDAAQGAAALLFVNAWHPVWMGTTQGAWHVVPGNWSIGVEFTFYAIFPILASYVTSPVRAVGFFVATVLMAGTANTLLWPILSARYGVVPADNFLYFWFPNQLCVFALGFCLYFLLQANTRLAALRPCWIAFAAVLAFAAIGFARTSQWVNWRIALPPAFLLASAAFVVFILAMSRMQGGILLNPAIRLMGRVSFSAYLLHFAVLEVLGAQPWLRGVFGLDRWGAVAGLLVIYIVAAAITAGCSWMSFSAIEQPMIQVGRRLIARRRLTTLSSML